MRSAMMMLVASSVLALAPAAIPAGTKAPTVLAAAAAAASDADTKRERRELIAKASGRATGRVIYENVVLIDARQSAPRPGMAIVVEDERIAAVVPMQELTEAQRKGATLHAAQGQYVVPGLMDTHVHYATLPDRPWAEADLKRAVYAGITGVRDMAGDVRSLADLSRSAWLNRIPSPDIFYSALMAGPDFFSDERTAMSALGQTPGQVPWMQAITPTTDLALAVAEARGTSASGIKIYADLDGALVRAIIAESRRQGFPVWTHLAVYPATPYDALGANSVSHVCMLGRYVMEPQKSRYGHENEPDYGKLDPAGPEIVRYGRALAESGTLLDATLSVYTRSTDPAPKGRGPGCPREVAGAITATLVKQGVQVSAGTDSGAAPDDPYPALYGELESLVRYAGFSPYEALVAATLNSARATGVARDYGTIEPGKYANFVLLSRNPMVDIGNLRSILLTVKRGHAYARSEYHHTPIKESDQ
jgi:imidazolonepropionase-like amidohydrolase